MRLLLSILIFLICPGLYAQKYSSKIGDKEITDFMVWLLAKDKSKTNRNVDNNVILNDTLVYSTADTAKNPLFLQYNIFNHGNKLDSFINKADAAFFIDQVKNQKSVTWDYQFSHCSLITYPKSTKTKKYNLDSLNKIYKTVWAYSLPIFSVDKRKVLIIERFYCGIVCGGGSFNLYEKNGLTWRKLKEFNIWAN